MTIQMNKSFRNAPLSTEQKDKIGKLQNTECQQIVQDLLIQSVNNGSRADRAVILGVASVVFEQNANDLMIMFELCKNVKHFQKGFLAATLVIFGAKSVKPASGKSAMNTYYVDPCQLADLAKLDDILENADFSEMEKRFKQYMGSVKKSDKGLKIVPMACNANGTLVHYSNAYKVAKATTVKAEEDKDTTKEALNAIKAVFKKYDLSRSELEAVLNEAIKSSKLVVKAL